MQAYKKERSPLSGERGTAMKNRIALIPAYEPDEKLLKLLEELEEADIDRVVVNDGSTKSPPELFEKAAAVGAPDDPTVVLGYPENHGKGYALRTGLRYIQEHAVSPAFVVTMDSDGQHTVKDAVRCLNAAEQHPDSLVLGCRKFVGKVPLRSRFGNGVTRLVYRMVSGVKVSDTQTGLRAFSIRLVSELLKVEGDRYEYEMNVLMDLAKKVPYTEVPIETIYENNNSGSHFRTFQDSFRIYKEIFKFAGSSLIGFVTDYLMYSLLVIITAGWGTASVPFSNICARVVSASVNYTINRKFVFKSKNNAVKSALEYGALAACILLLNTCLITFLTGTLGWNKFLAKILTEITFFSLSFLAQKFLIFRKKKDNNAPRQGEGEYIHESAT